MYKTYYKPDKAYNYFPNHKMQGPMRVISIGKSHPWPGYRTGVLHRDAYVLHFLRSGKIQYQGRIAQAPCSFLMVPEKEQYYEVPMDTDMVDQCWIIFSGPDAKEFLKKAGFPLENDIFPCPYVERVWAIFDELFDLESYNHQKDHFLLLSALFRLFSLYAGHNSTATKNRGKPIFVQRVQEYIHRNYASDLTEKTLAAQVNLSVNYMHRRFCESLGCPPIHYLNRYRIQCAKKLLDTTDYSVGQIAESVGFANGNYFCRVFQKQNFGISPSEYRKRSRAANEKADEAR
ncbi:MAG: helix-turn-helix transcriptional regulator [Clostridia bacterium]|nr:helix-turn-helix transcriptional regulator [Clostridia bacterium]